MLNVNYGNLRTVNETLEYKNVYNNIVVGTIDYLSKNPSVKCLVLGLSGGIDSTLCAAILKQVTLLSDIPLIGVSLPCSTNKDDENSSAAKAGEEFCSEFKTVSLQNLYKEAEDTFCKEFSLEPTLISSGNIKARLRGNFLYNLAGIRRGIVIDTDNRSESLLGYWTISGGDEADFNIIGDLYKTEVYKLATWVLHNIYGGHSPALEQALKLKPTDGNGTADSDVAALTGNPSLSYTDIDKILAADIISYREDADECYRQYLRGKSTHYSRFMHEVVSEYGEEVVYRVLSRVRSTQYKRNHRPLIIRVKDGKIVQKNGLEL